MMPAQHPPFPLAELPLLGVIDWGGFGSWIHIYVALQADAAASRLEALRNSALRARNGKANAEALWEGLWLLNEKLRVSIEDVRGRGLLLMCWHGTRSLEDVPMCGGAQ